MKQYFEIPNISTMSLTDGVIVGSREDEGSMMPGADSYEMPLAVTDIG